jgi:hypothetical protein
VYVDPQVQYNMVFETLRHPTEGEVMNVRRPVLYDGDRDAGDAPLPRWGSTVKRSCANLAKARRRLRQ